MKRFTLAAIAVILIAGVIFMYITRTPAPTIISYKHCRVQVDYYMSIDNRDLGYISAQQQLALCLCEDFIKTKDKKVALKIMELYKNYGIVPSANQKKKTGIDQLATIIRHRKTIFNPIILLD